jgi:cold shock CspA family protein
MRTLLVAAASALFFGALLTEVSTRLWPNNYFALLVASVVVLFVAGLLNLRLARIGRVAAVVAPEPGYEVTRPRAAATAQQPAAQRRSSAEPQRSGGSRSQAHGQGDAPARDQQRSERPRPARPESGAERRSEAAPRSESSRAQPAPPAGPREQGTVKWFNRTKGFGFVIRESGDEIFVHQRSIRPIGEGEERRRPALLDGQTVSFVVTVRDKGPQAEDVVPVEQA